MALSDRVAYDSITILEDGVMHVRRARIILDDGAEVTRQYFRTVLEPGQDVSTYPTRIRNLCAFIWTPAVVSAYLAWKATQGMP